MDASENFDTIRILVISITIRFNYNRFNLNNRF